MRIRRLIATGIAISTMLGSVESHAIKTDVRYGYEMQKGYKGKNGEKRQVVNTKRHLVKVLRELSKVLDFYSDITGYLADKQAGVTVEDKYQAAEDMFLPYWRKRLCSKELREYTGEDGDTPLDTAYFTTVQEAAKKRINTLFKKVNNLSSRIKANEVI